ncbi:HAMP domain-containing histidine kinase [Patescibacteria group bacterium]|nr:HAMP domain-containing histidine kinase [Patescibacteria group bacterium]
MDTVTRFRLTALFSVLFFLLFWIFSIFVYIWFSRSLGEGYITKVIERNVAPEHITAVRVAGGVALDQLRDILLGINTVMVFLIPLLAWILTDRTLRPIEQVNNRQRQFIADASHEMRTPLSILRGEMEIALKKDRPVHEYRKILKSAKEEIDGMTRLVTNLLFLARNNADSTEVKPEAVDVTDLLNSVLWNLRDKTQDKQLAVTLVPAKESLVIPGQISMLTVLFTNLLDNAIKYTPDKGKVTVRLAALGKTVVISIRDTGSGIDPLDQKRIFNRFYRSDYSRAHTKGFGLGLSIAQSIVTWHHGKIEVSSRPGHGTTFTVYLPGITGGRRWSRTHS